MTIAYVVIFVFGFFGNACIIYIVASHKTMKSTFNFLIVNMAIGDLLVSLFIMPSEVSKKCVQFRHNIFNFSQARYETMITKAKKNSVANSSFTWHDLIPSSSGKNTRVQFSISYLIIPPEQARAWYFDQGLRCPVGQNYYSE